MASLGLKAAVCALASAAAWPGTSSAQVPISSDTTENMACLNGVCAPTASEAILNVTDLENLLASGSVEVTTTGSGVQASDIDVTAALSWTSANALTLDAYQSIAVGQSVAVDGSGAVSLVTNDGGSGGTLSFISGGALSFAGAKNSLSIDGKAYTLVSSIAALAKHIRKNPSGYYALSANYDADQDGTYKKSPIATQFGGTFNGLGNTISNLTIDSSKKEIGLFADVGTAGAIDSLALTNVNILAKMERRDVGWCAGSIAGGSSGTIYNSYANGEIQGIAGDFLYFGGVTGCNGGVISYSKTSTTFSASSPRRRPGTAVMGGLVGDNGGTIEQSYATGAISSTSAAYSGGLVGINGGTIENCYAEGNVTVSVSYSYAGGLVGFAFPSSPITDSFSTGAPTAEGSNSYAGGFLGYDDNGSAGLSDDYWDTTTSGITNLSQGVGNIANDPGVTGETTAQLQSGLPAGFDPAIWAEDSNINNGLPYLIANPPQ